MAIITIHNTSSARSGQLRSSSRSSSAPTLRVALNSVAIADALGVTACSTSRAVARGISWTRAPATGEGFVVVGHRVPARCAVDNRERRRSSHGSGTRHSALNPSTSARFRACSLTARQDACCAPPVFSSASVQRTRRVRMDRAVRRAPEAPVWADGCRP